MKPVPEKKQEIADLEKKVGEAKRELNQIEQACNHQYGATVYDPIRHPGGYDPGDPPGTMGVDRRLPTSWSSSTEDRWRRECDVCGKVEYTTRVNEIKTVKKEPRW